MADSTPPENSGNATPSGALGVLDRWKQYMIAIAAVLAVAAQLWSAIEHQVTLAAVTLLLAVIILALYFVSHRLPSPGKRAVAIRVMMICVLIVIPLTLLFGLYTYSYLPRVTEPGTTVAVAKFVGPTLPQPYDGCRPSDMLVQTLARVGARFGRLRVFELPYTIDPDNRWAQQWAQAHGAFESADVIVYGEYSLDSTKSDTKADEIVINPEVSSVPAVPLGFKTAPLYSWVFPGSVATIEELCGSDLREAGPPRFLDDARRIALTITGLQALGSQDFETAQEAVNEAHIPEVAKPQLNPCAGDVTTEKVRKSLCPGVLAYYLGQLDYRLGHYSNALQEFSYASSRLGSAAPFMNLGELYQRYGNSKLAKRAYDNAVDVEPTSVAAIAARAAFERDELEPRQAALDLDRAMRLLPKNWFDQLILRGAVHKQNWFDLLTLTRAIYQRGAQGDAECGARILSQIIKSRGFNERTYGYPLVEYGEWLVSLRRDSAAREAKDVLTRALKMHPTDVEENYELGIALEESGAPSDKASASTYFLQAEYAFDDKDKHVRTDEDFLDRANAEAELAQEPHADPRLYQTALRDYDDAIAFSRAAYAYYDKGRLEEHKNVRNAERDLAVAASSRPYDVYIQSEYAKILKETGHSAEAKKVQALANADVAKRVAKGEEPVLVCQNPQLLAMNF